MATTEGCRSSFSNKSLFSVFSDQEGSGLGKWGGPPQGTFYSQEKVPRDLSLKISVRSCVFLKRKHPKKAYFDVFFRFSSYRHTAFRHFLNSLVVCISDHGIILFVFVVALAISGEFWLFKCFSLLIMSISSILTIFSQMTK